MIIKEDEIEDCPLNIEREVVEEEKEEDEDQDEVKDNEENFKKPSEMDGQSLRGD